MARARRYRDRWVTPAEARELQDVWRRRVSTRPLRRAPRTVAGIDAAVGTGRVAVAVSVFSFPALELVDEATTTAPLDFPYVPGLLGFREVPAMLEALGKLARAPDVLLVDGQGLAHPRRFGSACHLGVESGLPAVGCAKSRLCGEHREPGPRRGARVRLVHEGAVVGSVVRTRDGVRPLYVSVGHRVDLDGAVRLVLACARRYRLPEPIRRADQVAGLL